MTKHWTNLVSPLFLEHSFNHSTHVLDLTSPTSPWKQPFAGSSGDSTQADRYVVATHTFAPPPETPLLTRNQDPYHLSPFLIPSVGYIGTDDKRLQGTGSSISFSSFLVDPSLFTPGPGATGIDLLDGTFDPSHGPPQRLSQVEWSPTNAHWQEDENIFGINPQTALSDFKTEGPDWYTIYNPNAMASVIEGEENGRRLDVKLVHTLVHER